MHPGCDARFIQFFSFQSHCLFQVAYHLRAWFGALFLVPTRHTLLSSRPPVGSHLPCMLAGKSVTSRRALRPLPNYYSNKFSLLIQLVYSYPQVCSRSRKKGRSKTGACANSVLTGPIWRNRRPSGKHLQSLSPACKQIQTELVQNKANLCEMFKPSNQFEPVRT